MFGASLKSKPLVFQTFPRNFLVQQIARFVDLYYFGEKKVSLSN